MNFLKLFNEKYIPLTPENFQTIKQSDEEKKYVDVFESNFRRHLKASSTPFDVISKTKMDILSLGSGYASDLLPMVNILSDYKIIPNSYLGVEIDPVKIKFSKKRFYYWNNVNFYDKPIENFLKDNKQKFDLIILAHPDPALITSQLGNVLEIIARSLKDDGVVIVSLYQKSEQKCLNKILLAILKEPDVDQANKLIVSGIKNNLYKASDNHKKVKVFGSGKTLNVSDDDFAGTNDFYHLIDLNDFKKSLERIKKETEKQLVNFIRAPFRITSISQPKLFQNKMILKNRKNMSKIYIKKFKQFTKSNKTYSEYIESYDFRDYKPPQKCDPTFLKLFYMLILLCVTPPFFKKAYYGTPLFFESSTNTDDIPSSDKMIVNGVSSSNLICPNYYNYKMIFQKELPMCYPLEDEQAENYFNIN